MQTHYHVENPFRNAVECYVALTFLAGGLLVFWMPHVFLLDDTMLWAFESIVLGMALWRGWQGVRLIRFQQRLLQLRLVSLATDEVPLIDGLQYVGEGFAWEGQHTQRKAFLQEVENAAYQKKGACYHWARAYERNHHNALASALKWQSPLNPLRALPPIGGKPWLHGLSEHEKPLGILESQRAQHTLILGTTGVGKTRLLSILANQDIRRGKAVIILDPKGDTEFLRDVYAACQVAGRLPDFKIVHVGFPSLSAKLNPLSSYSDISDVATRVTAAINASGEGMQFKDFAWKYVNIVAKCLEEMGETINYRLISFYIMRPDLLLVKYADTVFVHKDPDYAAGIQAIQDAHELACIESKTPFTPLPRTVVVKRYFKDFTEAQTTGGNTDFVVNEIITPLYEMAKLDKNYYDKITASVGPVLDKINQSNAKDIFSFEGDTEQPVVTLIDAIKRKQVIYIGLNALVNAEVSSALGKAIISDLVSCAGRIYNANEVHPVSLYFDEFSELVQDEFVTLLNKSRGAGFEVTSLGQTLHDIAEGYGGNHDKAKMTEGNKQTLIMMRVKTKETANLLVEQLPEVEVLARTEGSSASDTPHGEEGIYFNTGNDVRLNLKATPMLAVNDLVSLPVGHAFLFTNGGELYKLRLPLPANETLAPRDFVELIETVNTGEACYVA